LRERFFQFIFMRYLGRSSLLFAFGASKALKAKIAGMNADEPEIKLGQLNFPVVFGITG